MRPVGLYLHIPFCAGKCPYCDFYSLSASFETMQQYTQTLCGQLLQWGQTLCRPADTLYFGGGTPGLLGAERLAKLVAAAKSAFVLKDAEITVEVNPASARELDFARLRRAGVNRLSIGLQSANDDELLLLGRRHTAQDALNTIRYAQDAGFDNISLDLMLAVQKQTRQSLARSIAFCSRANIQHVSAYLLKIEEGTPYAKKRGQLALPDEDQQSALYLFACTELEKAGFMQYEISNFAVPGKESRHNLKYWNDEEYLGLGPAAHSFLNGRRFYYPRSLVAFMQGANPLGEEDGEEPIPGGSREEYAMLRLRLNAGLTESGFAARFGQKIPQGWRDSAARYQKHGLTVCSEEGIRLTPQGFLLSNTLIAEILF